MLALITDSTADLSPSELALQSVKVVPARLTLKGHDFLSSEVDAGELLRRIAVTQTLPSIAAPTAEDYEKAFQEALDGGADEVMSFHISRKLSQSYANGEKAAKRFGAQVSLIDGTVGTYALGLQVLRAGRLRDAGASRSDIKAEILKVQKQQFVRFALHTVKFLYMSGRVSGLQASLGRLLNIKPVFGYRDGLIEPMGRERGMDRALNAMARELTEHMNTLRGTARVAFLHTPGGEERAQELNQLLGSWGLTYADEGMHALGTTMLTVSGPKAVGVVVEPV